MSKEKCEEARNVMYKMHQIKEGRRADVYMFALERVFWEVEKKEAI